MCTFMPFYSNSYLMTKQDLNHRQRNPLMTFRKLGADRFALPVGLILWQFLKTVYLHCPLLLLMFLGNAYLGAERIPHRYEVESLENLFCHSCFLKVSNSYIKCSAVLGGLISKGMVPTFSD